MFLLEGTYYTDACYGKGAPCFVLPFEGGHLRSPTVNLAPKLVLDENTGTTGATR